MTSQSFSVDGLHCQGCAATVTEALSALGGVGEVDVDLNTKGTSTVQIDGDTTLSNAQVQSALDSEGNFTVLP